LFRTLLALFIGLTLHVQVGFAEPIDISIVVSKNSQTGNITATVHTILPFAIDDVWQVVEDHKNLARLFPQLLVNRPLSSDIIESLKPNKLQDTKALQDYLKKKPTVPVDQYDKELFSLRRYYFYRVVNMPFFMRNRWYLAKETRDMSKRQLGSIVMRYERIAGTVKHLEAEWRLSEMTGAETNVQFTCTFHMGVGIPKFMFGKIRRDYKKSFVYLLELLNDASIRSNDS